MKPNIDFVSAHHDKFEAGVKDLLDKPASAEAEKWTKGIKFTGTEDIVDPQIHPEQGRELLARMPESLRKMSLLKEVAYHTFGEKRVIPVPGYDEEGNFDKKQVQLVSIDEFPRKEDHQSRILVGVSTGTTIYPTPIPKTVSEDERAVYLYQLHVFLHEFFHTIDYKRRDPVEREKIVLEVDGQQFTYQYWWKAFEELILSAIEPMCVSSYANTYFDDLNQKTADEDYDKFTYALAEQICETFVAYMLNIISNDEGWTDFKGQSFGNIRQLKKFIKEESSAANLKWILMDKLCRAKVVKMD